MRLNLGCGPHKVYGWINVDCNPDWEPDVVADMTCLPYASRSVEDIYCGHVLEHLTFDDELPRALTEMHRVLTDTGALMVVGPCLDAAKRMGADEETVRRIWPGDRHPGVPGGDHKWPSTGELTVSALRRAGFGATEMPPYAVPTTWPIVSRVAWQFAVIATP